MRTTKEVDGVGILGNLCPICKVPLLKAYGSKMNPNDPKFGVIVFCGNNKCSAQEVFGHGDKEKDAYEVVYAKFVKRRTSKD